MGVPRATILPLPDRYQNFWFDLTHQEGPAIFHSSAHRGLWMLWWSKDKGFEANADGRLRYYDDPNDALKRLRR